VRSSIGILLASGLVLSLAACAAPSQPTIDGGTAVDQASCAPIWTPGGLALDVTATGDFGTAPLKIAFPIPLVSHETTSTSVLIQGDGPVIGPTDIVAGTLTLFDASTGKLMTQTDKTTLVPLTSEITPYFGAAACERVGSRVAAVGTTSEILGAGIVKQSNLDPDFTIVAVLDIQDAYLPLARGTSVPPQNGLPTVSLTTQGRPGLSFTNADAPTELRAETLVTGTGSVVGADDRVLMHYVGVTWDSHTVFDSTWENGFPAQLALSDVVPGLATALTGRTVGSQVLVSIPPALGYGDSPPQGSGIVATDTLVFVVDILGILPPA
jgi:peptidylprolyl isomerase